MWHDRKCHHGRSTTVYGPEADMPVSRRIRSRSNTLPTADFAPAGRKK
jgi:hypothetical protein